MLRGDALKRPDPLSLWPFQLPVPSPPGNRVGPTVSGTWLRSDPKGALLQDRSFTFILKTPPASVLLQKAAGVAKGSGTPNSAKVGQVTRAQLKARSQAHPAQVGSTGDIAFATDGSLVSCSS